MRVPRGGDSWINCERTKFLAEKAVRESGLPFIISQPAHILGPGDTRNWSRLIRLVDQGKLPGVPPGVGAFADVREIAKAQVRAWQGQRYGECYLMGGEQATFLELIIRVGVMLGRKTPRRATPAFALRAYARVLYGVSLFTRRMPEITTEDAVFTCKQLWVDSAKAIAQLGYRQTPLDSLLADTSAWMQEEKMIG